MDYVIASAVASRSEILKFLEQARQDIFIECSHEGGTKRMVLSEIANLQAFSNPLDWSIESQQVPIPIRYFALLDSIASGLRACVFHVGKDTYEGKLSGSFGKVRFSRREADARVVEYQFCNKVRIHREGLSSLKYSEIVERFCRAARYEIPKIELIDGQPVWNINPSSLFRVVHMGVRPEALITRTPDQFIDLGGVNFQECHDRLRAIIKDFNDMPTEGEFMCAGDGVDSFNDTRTSLKSIFPGDHVWKLDTCSPLNEDAVSILSGGPFVEGIDYIPFFQVGVSDRLPSMSFHSIKHHGNDMWQVVSSHHKDREGMIAWLRSLSPSLYPDSIE
jgi:hypothetical protein